MTWFLYPKCWLDSSILMSNAHVICPQVIFPHETCPNDSLPHLSGGQLYTLVSSTEL